MWSTHPRFFVIASDGFNIPGMCFISMDPSSFHPCIAKNLISMCRVLFVGILLFIILIVDLLSSYNIVGPFSKSVGPGKKASTP